MDRPVCGSVGPRRRACLRTEGHAGSHYDPGFTHTWTDSEAEVEPEPEPEPAYVNVNGGWVTRREATILQMAANGLNTDATAIALGLSANTVKTHRSRIMKRISAENIPHAVALALRAGVIT